MPEHKKQHFVPAGYLKAWCDPTTPEGQEPYVWVFNKDGTGAHRKAPSNIFHESDLYTIQMEGGGRDLHIETTLSRIESELVALRERTIDKGIWPGDEGRALLCIFAAAMRSRTPAQRDHLQVQWGKAQEKIDALTKWAETASPEQRRRASSPPSSGQPISLEMVKAMATQPLQASLLSTIQVEAPMLFRGVDLAILVSVSSASFITSDHPCVWSDPDGYKRPPFYQGPALVYPTIEITLPLSPRHCLFMNRRGATGFLEATKQHVEIANRTTRFACSEYFVNSENRTRPFWFEQGVEPDDSWRKRHERGEFQEPPE
jgi:hypothetical protein